MQNPSFGAYGLSSRGEYYNTILRQSLEELDTDETFAALRGRVYDTAANFVTNALPTLPTLIELPNSNIFTHYDLAPQNLLVSDGDHGTTITGIVDFEFAGFFPFEEEFLNIEINSNEDWPGDSYAELVQILKGLNACTPYHEDVARYWDQMKALYRLKEALVPWTLAQGSLNPEDEEAEVDRASEEVLQALRTLEVSGEE